MTVTVKHSKTNAISDWTQAQLDEQIELGNFAPGTTLADIVLPSDWNNDHTLTGVGTMAEQDADTVAITGGTATLSSVTTPSVTATTNNLTLSAISTGAVNLATAGGTQFKAIDATSSVNVWNVRGGDGSTTSPRFTTEGTGTNIAGQFNTKGTGALQFFSGNTEQMRISNTASAVNYVQVTGGATGTYPAILGTGSDGTVGLQLAGKGGTIDFRNNGIGTATQFSVAFTASSVNYLNATGSGVSGNAPRLFAQGTDTNISMAFQPKGTGAINLAAGSSGVNISNGGTVTAITRTAAGTGYTSLPTMTISAPTTAGGVQATATYTMGLAGVPTITSGGTGYTVGDTLTFVGGTGGAATLTVSTVSAGIITGVTVGSFGTYTALPTNPISVTGGTGSSATFTATWAINSVFTITNAGSGYIEQPTVTFSGGGGSGAAAYATVGSGTVIRSLGINMDFYTPTTGIGFRIADSQAGTTTPSYFTVNGNNNNAFLNASGGSGANVGMYYISRGTGQHSFTTNASSVNEQFRITNTASAVNFVQVTGAATTSFPIISAQGSDTNISMQLYAKGTGAINFWTSNGGSRHFQVAHTAGTIVNYATVTGSATGAAPAFSVAGTDTNIDLALTPKGTGRLRFGTHTATADTAISGYIEILDSGGTVRRLAVVS